jgi:hypothetical protein
MASDRTGYVSDRGDAAGGPDRYADDRVGATGGDTGNADLAGDRTGYGPSGAEVTGGPVADDRGFGGGVGGRGVDAGTAEGGYPTGEPTVASTGAASGTGGATGAGPKAGPLLGEAESEGFRARWTDVQTGFVDAPRRSVEQADALVAELMQHLAKTFADERSGLESQWDRGEDIPTDDLRTAFQRYRSFFERLLST